MKRYNSHAAKRTARVTSVWHNELYRGAQPGQELLTAAPPSLSQAAALGCGLQPAGSRAARLLGFQGPLEPRRLPRPKFGV